MSVPCISKQNVYYIASAIIVIIIFYLIIYLNTACYYFDIGDTLPSVEDSSFSPKPRSIFFHETSCRGGLNVRQACSVEAAARAHTKRDIYILFSSPVTYYALKTGCLATLLEFPNVKLFRIHVAKYSEGTAVHSILINGMKDSKYPVQHYADILRILTLNKFGGLYLDTDMIVTRSLDELPTNFVAKEMESDVASGIISFDKDKIGRYVTEEIIKEISKSFIPSRWSHFGADAIDRVIKRLCPRVVRSQAYESKSIQNCKGVTIFDYELFYPQYYGDIDDIFLPPATEFDLERPYTYHMWDFLSHNRTIHRDTVYDIVAKTYCPTIHKTYSDEFSTKK